MILGLNASAFFLLMLCAFAAGIMGALAVLLVHALCRKTQRTNDSVAPERNWQKLAKDEQMYSGR